VSLCVETQRMWNMFPVLDLFMLSDDGQFERPKHVVTYVIF
jgi:hypothetical protein